MKEHTEVDQEFDVIVVGGGPAGSTIATLLAQRGRNVLMLEREEFPRFHVGESLISGLVPLMRELGLEEELDRRFQWKYGVTLRWGNDPKVWRTAFGEASPFDHSWHVDRASFDKLLLDNAVKHGVRVVENAKVGAALTDPDSDRITGVRWTHEGTSHSANAQFVVDASGQSRVISRHLTDVTWQPDLRNVAIWRYFDGYTRLPDPDDILIEAVPVVGGWLWGIPLSADRLSVGYVAAADEVGTKLASGRTHAELFEAALDESTEVSAMIAPAEQFGDERTARDFSHAAHTFSGPGWLAVGDAAAFVDPLFSSGVWLGTSGAWLAARAVDACLTRPEATPTAMARFEELYRQIVEDMLAYVRYFSDPLRNKEDYLEKAEAAVASYSEGHQLGFISLISGLSALPGLLNFDPLAEEPAPILHLARPA